MGTLAHSDENGLWMHFATFKGPRDDSPDVTLIPMVHVANKKFISEAYAETWRYDFVLYEGAYIPLSSLFRQLYPFLARKLGLTPQGSGKLSLKAQGWKREVENDPYERIMVKTIDTPSLKLSRRQKQIIADMDKKGFNKAVQDMPISAKLAFPFLLLGVLVTIPFSVKRDDLISLVEDSEETEPSSFIERCFKHYFKYAIDDRDAYLKHILKRTIMTCQSHELSICVQYGQGHMKALKAFLDDELGYRLNSARKVLAVSKTRHISLKDSVTGYGLAYSSYGSLPSNMSEEHQRYDRKLTSVENRRAAWDKVSDRKIEKQVKSWRRASTSYFKYKNFNQHRNSTNWMSTSKNSNIAYDEEIADEKSIIEQDLRLENIDEVEGYSVNTDYTPSSYSSGFSEPGSSYDNPIKIDDSLVFVVESPKDAA